MLITPKELPYRIMNYFKNISLLKISLLAFALPIISFSQSIVINEVVSSNHGSYYDEDGETPDWIELYNTTGATLDLSGYGLSDDEADLFKWTFETGSIEPDNYLLVFASDKDRQSTTLIWDMLIQEGDSWKYILGDSEPPSIWNTVGFNDGSWSTGNSGIGYGDGDDNTIIPTTLSFYMRKTFEIDDIASIAMMLFHMDYDDAYVAYINGEEISRSNIGTPGSPVYYNSTADNHTEPALVQGIDLPAIDVPLELLVEGSNVLSIQVHNYSIGSSDLTAIPFLTLGKTSGTGSGLPDYLIAPPQALFHTNFKISSGGEDLILTSPDSDETDFQSIPQLDQDIGYGRQPDGTDEFYYFDPPSPGAENTNGVETLAQAPIVSPQPGFYVGSVTVNLGIIPDNIIYTYTLDGTRPNLESSEYTSPLTFNSTTVLRVMAATPDGFSQHHSSYSYFVDENPDLPVMSLIFEPDDFFAVDSGIYVMGTGASPDFPYFGANFWEDWERPIHIEYFEDGSDLSYSAPGGVKIFGGWSRGNAQRSLSFFARGIYGAQEFDFPFFPDNPIDEFESFVLRNSGNDWQYSGYRDGLMTGLVSERDLETQSFQPVEVFFNGQFWGIYNMREKVSEHFVASHADIDSDDINLLEADGWAIHGNSEQYQILMQYVESADLSNPFLIEYVNERVDIENFIVYQFSQIYFNNQDWPGNNIKFWNANEPGSKWRWILYDTDFGYGIWNASAYFINTLEFATDPSGPGWPNPPWSTLLLRSLLDNADFVENFILTGCDLLNSEFKAQTAQNAVTTHRDWIAPVVDEQFERWGHNNMSNWDYEYNVMSNFALYRPIYMRQHMQEFFDLGAINELTINVSPYGTGNTRIHSLTPTAYPWSGHYFEEILIDIEAMPEPGYVFSHWEGIPSADQEIALDLSSDMDITAVFVLAPEGPIDIVINEINYHSSDEFDSKDWVEIYNASLIDAHLNGWTISDSDDDNVFVIDDLILAPDHYLIICKDTLAFRSIHGAEPRIIGDLDFNFSNGGELLRLFDFTGTLIDSVSYDDDDPWPIAPDGDGPTLELIHPTLENGLSESWAASIDLGTPGLRNSSYVEPVSVEENLSPRDLKLGIAYPNPFNAQLSIPYSVTNSENIAVQIFNIRGALISSEVLTHNTSGYSLYHWDGKDKFGQDCASGMYIVKMSQSNQSRNIKVALLR